MSISKLYYTFKAIAMPERVIKKTTAAARITSAAAV
jgi:hypothetical protein